MNRRTSRDVPSHSSISLRNHHAPSEHSKETWSVIAQDVDEFEPSGFDRSEPCTAVFAPLVDPDRTVVCFDELNLYLQSWCNRSEPEPTIVNSSPCLQSEDEIRAVPDSSPGRSSTSIVLPTPVCRAKAIPFALGLGSKHERRINLSTVIKHEEQAMN